MAYFDRYIGIDYSGAKTADSPLTAIRVYMAERNNPPTEQFRDDKTENWTRRTVAHWLAARLREHHLTLVGIDHAFSFPVEYFDNIDPESTWARFLEGFSVDFPSHVDGNTVKRLVDRVEYRPLQNKKWLRLTEKWTAGAKSVFNFRVRGTVAYSSHAGIPWIAHLKQNLGEHVRFWPFDGWHFQKQSVVAEVYPSLWMRRFPCPELDATSDQRAAYAVTAWLQHTDIYGTLPTFMNPQLSDSERKLVDIEGWILGVF